MKKQTEPKSFRRFGTEGETFITRTAMEGIVNTNSCYPEATMRELDEGQSFTTFLATYQRIENKSYV